MLYGVAKHSQQSQGRRRSGGLAGAALLLPGRPAEAVLLGASGGVCGGANIIPKLYVDLYDAARSRDMETMEALQKRVMQISTSIYGVGRYQSSYLKGLKCALSCMGICSDFLAEPFHRFRSEEHDVIRRYLEELGIVQKQ